MTQTGAVTYFDWDESTRGQIPSPAPTGRAIRYSSANLLVSPTLSPSNEVTPGNEPQDAIVTGYEGGGDFGIDFTAKNYDRFITNLLGSTFAYQTGNSGNRVIRASGTAQVTWVASSRTLTTAGTWTVTPAAGNHVMITGSGNAYLDGLHRVDPATTPNSTTIILEQDGILSNIDYVPNIAAAKNMVIVRGERVTNSLTPSLDSLGIERRTARVRGTYLGADAEVSPSVDYAQFLAVMATRIQLQATGDSAWTGQISLRSSLQQNNSDADGSDTVMADPITDAYDTAVFQGINSVKKCRFYFPDISDVAGDAGKIEDTMRICPQSLSVELANNLAATALMCAQPEFDYQQGEPIGQVNVVGIYETPYPLVAFDQQYAGVFELALVSADGYGYLIRFPRAKMTVARADVGGRAQTLVTNMTVKAFRQTETPVVGDSSRAIEVYRFLPAA